MKPEELKTLETHLRKTFRLDALEVRKIAKKTDAAEVYIAGEFIGVVYRDEDEGEVCYQFQMAILDCDLDADEPLAAKGQVNAAKPAAAAKPDAAKPTAEKPSASKSPTKPAAAAPAAKPKAKAKS